MKILDGQGRKVKPLGKRNDYLRCLIDESWMKDSSVRTSCTGPQIRQIEGASEIVRTSNLASSMAAHLSAEQLRGSVLGTENVMNRRLTYTAYPHLELSVSHPMRKQACPGCAVRPPSKIEWLKGTVMKVTLKEALSQIARFLGTMDFELSVHRLHYRKIVHAGFIIDDVCRSCGKPIEVMRHEGRVFPDDLLCGECSVQGKHARVDTGFGHGEILLAFTEDTVESVKQLTLFDLGYPLGAHIEVIQRNGAFDFLDKDKIITTIFAFEDDARYIHQIHEL